jgi:putative DNA primase/helicase
MNQRKYPTVDELEGFANGNWFDILSRYASGLELAIKKPGQHVTCPFHGGKSDFRMHKTKGPEYGLSYCTCGTRNGWQLLQDANKWTFVQAKDAVAEYFGLGSCSEVERKEMTQKAEEKNRKRAREKEIEDKKEAKAIAHKRNGIWKNSIPMSDKRSSVAQQYLRSRKLEGAALTPHIRYHPGMAYRNEEGAIIDFYPTILSRVYDNNGKPLTIHRTYLDRSTGGKANCEEPKKLMPVPDLWASNVGRVIPVTDVGNRRLLGITEGIETAIAASLATNMSVWATVSATPLPKFVPPAGVETLVIFADLDRSGTGEKAAKELVKNLKASGWKGRVEIALPNQSLLTDGKSGVDWADVWYDYGALGFSADQRQREVYHLAA